MSFKYKSIKRPDGNLIKTPSIPVTLIGNSSIRVEFMALIDSGADLSVIPQDVAELLDLKLDGKKDKSRDLGGEVDVVNTNMQINIKKGHEDYALQIPVQVVLGDWFLRFQPTVETPVQPAGSCTQDHCTRRKTCSA